MSKQIPLLFSSLMVQAILDGRKTMTRRINKLGNISPRATEVVRCDSWPKQGDFVARYELCIPGLERYEVTDIIKCPYGKPGDILWVRVSWKLVGWSFDDGLATIEYADGTRQEFFYAPDGGSDEAEDWMVDKVAKLVQKDYYAPTSLEEAEEGDENLYRTEKKQPFEPSIHMPKWACRIWLERTEGRVERLQDITEVDSINEGVLKLGDEWIQKQFPEYYAKWLVWSNSEDYLETTPPIGPSPRQRFIALWQLINGPVSWDVNPWVWVVPFKVLSTTGKPEGI